MIKIREDKNLIMMTRSDTLIVKINIKDSDGNDYVPESTDTLRFALKKNYNDEDVLIYKEIPIDTLTLRLDSRDTANLEQPATYYYDIQLTYGDGIVSTIIANAMLKITEEVD